MTLTVSNNSLQIARVEPLTRTRALRGPFDYRLRPDQTVRVGSLLRIPFGGASTLGVVVELASRSELEPDRLAEPDAVLSGELPDDLVELARWMAGEYCSTVARALGLMLAPGAARGTRRREVLVASLSEEGARAPEDEPRLTAAQRALIEHLRREGPSVAACLGTAALRRLERRGLVALSVQDDRRARAMTTLRTRSAEIPRLTEDQESAVAEVLRALREHTPPPVTVGSALGTMSLVAGIYAAGFGRQPVRPADLGPESQFYQRMDGNGAALVSLAGAAR